MSVTGGAAEQTLVEIDGPHAAGSRNLDKVLYPEAGFTKGEVIDYYARIAPAMLPHIGDRGVTLRRYPNGVDGKSFFEKRCPSHRPEWVARALGPGDRGGAIDYCRLDDLASLVWAANMAALEIHAPMARGGDIETPTMVVFDLDPGAPADIRECAEVGLWIRDVLDGLGLQCFAEDVRVEGPAAVRAAEPAGHTHEHAVGVRAQPSPRCWRSTTRTACVDVMRKDLRGGKVFIDWSQNTRHKTTVGVYSLRARPRPTVSTPVTWDEVEAAADGAPLSFEAADVLERVESMGDLFAAGRDARAGAAGRAARPRPPHPQRS